MHELDFHQLCLWTVIISPIIFSYYTCKSEQIITIFIKSKENNTIFYIFMWFMRCEDPSVFTFLVVLWWRSLLLLVTSSTTVAQVQKRKFYSDLIIIGLENLWQLLKLTWKTAFFSCINHSPAQPFLFLSNLTPSFWAKKWPNWGHPSRVEAFTLIFMLSMEPSDKKDVSTV